MNENQIREENIRKFKEFSKLFDRKTNKQNDKNVEKSHEKYVKNLKTK